MPYETPSPVPAFLPRKVAGATATEKLLRDQLFALLPDNKSVQFTLLSGKVKPGIAYVYEFPPWTRHWLLVNSSAGLAGGTSGNLYYGFNEGIKDGAKQLPADYDWLTSSDYASETSVYRRIWVMADSTSTDQGWRLRFEGRVEAEPDA